MNNRFLTITPLLACSTLFLAGCGGDNSSFETPPAAGEVSNSGTISQRNFSLLTTDVNPAVIDASTDIFTETEVELTVYIGDRNNQSLSDEHTINFVPEYGLVNPSTCVTEEGKCSVIWHAIKRPKVGGPGSDGYVTITAYTTGEEAFTDSNGNNVFDDADAGFEDLEEPYVDADYTPNVNNGFLDNTGDIIIDVVSTNDPTGVNTEHDYADGFYNGPGCTHTSMCGTSTSVAVFDMVTMFIIGNATYTIGGTVTGIPATESLVIQNNGGDDLTITASGDFTFSTALADGDTYTVTVLTPPASAPNCTFSGGTDTGTVASADVANVTINCVP